MMFGEGFIEDDEPALPAKVVRPSRELAASTRPMSSAASITPAASTLSAASPPSGPYSRKSTAMVLDLTEDESPPPLPAASVMRKSAQSASPSDGKGPSSPAKALALPSGGVRGAGEASASSTSVLAPPPPSIPASVGKIPSSFSPGIQQIPPFRGTHPTPSQHQHTAASSGASQNIAPPNWSNNTLPSFASFSANAQPMPSFSPSAAGHQHPHHAHHHAQQQPPGLGRIPIINSSNARLPSTFHQPPPQHHGGGFLPPPPNRTTTYAAPPYSAQPHVQMGNQMAYSNGGIAQGGRYRDANNGTASASKGKEKEVIDLTEEADDDSDDDEIIVDESPVCIGQITSLALVLYPIPDVQPMPAPPPLSADVPPPPIPRQPPLPILIQRGPLDPKGHETLRLSSAVSQLDFGVMEHKAADVIAPLLGDGKHGSGVTNMGRGGGKSKIWCVASVVRKGEKNPMMMTMHLLLFALPFAVPFISDRLAENNLYLEHPPSYNPAYHNGYRYSNPHNPMPGVDPRRRAGLTPGYASYGQRTLVKKEDMAKQQVEDVFHNLKSGVDLEETEPHPLVATRLYPHQKQALSFLLDRERLIHIPPPPAPNQRPPANSQLEEIIVSLWRRSYDIYRRPAGWMSLVTDLSIPGPHPPPQARGSILADDMGLGKTIVVISLVAATLDEAREWAKGPVERDEIDQRFDGVGEGGKRKAADGGAGVVDLDQFHSSMLGVNGGLYPHAAAKASSSSKKKEAKAKREKKREDAASIRFQRLVTRSRATLIVCPLSTVQNWEAQFEEHVVKRGTEGTEYRFKEEEEAVPAARSKKSAASTKAKGKAKQEDDADDEEATSFSTSSVPAKSECAISLYVYHGNARLSDPHKLADYDVVVTTFSTVGTEYSRQSRAEEERAEDARLAAEEDSDDEPLCVYDNLGNLVPVPPMPELPDEETGKKGKKKRKRKRVEGNGASPLQQIQWFRVVLDEAHIIKEHTTIQARAACDLSASRRTALSGTPLQNSLNDLFSLVRFLRLEPFLDRSVWTQHIGALAKIGDPLGVSRLQLIMRHLALRRTKTTVDKNGKPILSLPPNTQTLVSLAFDPAETAFYQSHHNRYKHDFRKLEETDSVMKNYCSILQELLRLRQICVHMALVRDSEDNAKNGSGGGDLIQTIERHGISKPRAVQLLALMRDAGAAQCAECGHEMVSAAPVGRDAFDDAAPEEDAKKPVKKARRTAKSATASASASAACSEQEDGSERKGAGQSEIKSVVTRCQHLFCQGCFVNKVSPGWPHQVGAAEKVICSVCRTEISPALDVVELGGRELERALEGALEDEERREKTGKKVKGTRLFEHSTKTKALLADLYPFSQANPASSNYWGGMDEGALLESGQGGVIGFQPVKGEVVKSVIFSQWTTLLDRVGDTLDEANIKFGRLDGGMNRDQRTKAMDSFKTDPSVEVLLVSLRAGGVGLNLTVARRVYLMEPFWNPAVENQAVDRIHRLGQTKPVQTVRFVIAKSIEENMLKIQQRKTDLANMSMGQTLSKQELQKRRMEDLKMLLS